jgi:hypothetical protein
MQAFLPFYLALCFFVILTYAKKNGSYIYGLTVQSLCSLLLMTFFVILVSLRGHDHPGDTQTYLDLFNYLSKFEIIGGNKEFRIEKGFLYFTYILSRLSSNDYLFLFSNAILQVLLWYVSFRLWVPSRYLLLSTLVFVSLFASYNLGTNVLRQGIAIPLSFIAMWLLFNRKFLLGFIVLIIATLFHKSTLIVFLIWLVSYKKIGLKYYFLIWIICSLLSMVGFFESITSLLPLEASVYNHLVREGAIERYQLGFRLDFWLFSFIPVLLFICLKTHHRNMYSGLIKSYLALYSIFIIMFEFPYSDRIGMYTWCMLPIFLSIFVGHYRFKLLNSSMFTVLVIILVGCVFFQYYPLMDIGIHIDEL